MNETFFAGDSGAIVLCAGLPGKFRKGRNRCPAENSEKKHSRSRGVGEREGEGEGVYTCHSGVGVVGLIWYLGTHLAHVSPITWEYWGSGVCPPSLVVSILIKHSLPYYSDKTSSKGPRSDGNIPGNICLLGWFDALLVLLCSYCNEGWVCFGLWVGCVVYMIYLVMVM